MNKEYDDIISTLNSQIEDLTMKNLDLEKEDTNLREMIMILIDENKELRSINEKTTRQAIINSKNETIVQIRNIIASNTK